MGAGISIPFNQSGRAPEDDLQVPGTLRLCDISLQPVKGPVPPHNKRGKGREADDKMTKGLLIPDSPGDMPFLLQQQKLAQQEVTTALQAESSQTFSTGTGLPT